MSETIFINVDEAAKIIEADKQKALDSYRTALKKKIEERSTVLKDKLELFADEEDDADVFTAEVLRMQLSECEKFLTLIDQTTIEK